MAVKTATVKYLLKVSAVHMPIASRSRRSPALWALARVSIVARSIASYRKTSRDKSRGEV